MACSIWFGKHTCEKELPSNYNDFYAIDTNFVLVLVIKIRTTDNLHAIRDKLKRTKQIQRESRLWNFQVFVVNEEIARKYELTV